MDYEDLEPTPAETKVLKLLIKLRSILPPENWLYANEDGIALMRYPAGSTQPAMTESGSVNPEYIVDTVNFYGELSSGAW